jgi:hypothetical protein
MTSSARQKKYQRNELLEIALKDINGLLLNLELKLISEFKKNKYPVIFILGNPRSGSTLLLQWLASLGCFAYPTNILSRFYNAPCIGAKVQKILVEYDFKGEIFSPDYEKKFHSDLGKTKGPLASHEFWYFWRRFFKYGEIQKLNQKDIDKLDVASLLSEIAGLEAEYQKPLVFKGMMFNWDIELLDSIFEKALFINLKKSPIYNMEDLLFARKKFFNDLTKWYSFKPPEYEELKSKDPIGQVAGQVMYTNKSIDKQFAKINSKKIINFCYEDLCSNPEELYKIIVNKYKDQGYKLPDEYVGEKKFSIQNTLEIIDERKAIMELNKYS